MGSIMRQRFEQEKKKMTYMYCATVFAVVAFMVAILYAFLIAPLQYSANEVQEMHYKCFDVDFHYKPTLLCAEKSEIRYEEVYVQFPDLRSDSTITIAPPFISFECNSSQECTKKATNWRNNVGLSVEKEGDK